MVLLPLITSCTQVRQKRKVDLHLHQTPKTQAESWTQSVLPEVRKQQPWKNTQQISEAKLARMCDSLAPSLPERCTAVGSNHLRGAENDGFTLCHNYCREGESGKYKRKFARTNEQRKPQSLPE